VNSVLNNLKNSPRFCNHPSFTVVASFKVPDAGVAPDVDMTGVLENGRYRESRVFVQRAAFGFRLHVIISRAFTEWLGLSKSLEVYVGESDLLKLLQKISSCLRKRKASRAYFT